MGATNINDLGAAVRHFIHNYLHGRAAILGHVDGVKGPISIYLEHMDTKKIYFVFLKRDYLHSFGYLFKIESERGHPGQTLNLRALKLAAQNNADIVIVMPDASVWFIDAKTWLQYAEENGTIRVPTGEVGEEASIPAHMLRPFEQELAKDRVLTKDEEKEANRLREYWELVDEWRSLPMKKCPYCDFKNVYEKSILHHLTYTHKRGHPSPPNEWGPTMDEKSYLDHEDAMSGKTGRRSGLKVL